VLVGLTGGIGAGKSTVARLLAEHGAVVIEADELARVVVERGKPALRELAERFGEGIFQPDGSLDRKALAAIAFADDDSRLDLNRITWPRIDEEFDARIAAARPDAVIVYDVALLLEMGVLLKRPYAAVILVEAPIDDRIDRLAAGRGIDPADAAARIASQTGDEERRAVATHVIDNSGDEAALRRQVAELWADLLRRRDAGPVAPVVPATPERPE
jgi:dephospho-CoA kinase